MKKILLTLVGIVCSLGMWADATNIKFEFNIPGAENGIDSVSKGVSGGSTTGSSNLKLKKDYITLTAANAYFTGGKNLKVYKSSSNFANSLVITAQGKISAVKFYYNKGTYHFNEALGKAENFTTKCNSADTVVYTPAEAAKSLEFATNTKGQVELQALEVTYTYEPPIDVTGVELNTTSAEMNPGERLTLTATVSPSNATNKDVTWSSSDEDVVTVNDKGQLRSYTSGTATITVTTADGNKTATCSITVKEKNAPIYSVFYETFDKLDGNGGRDGIWSDFDPSKLNMAMDLDACDKEGWTASDYVYSGFACALLYREKSSKSEVYGEMSTGAIGAEGLGVLTFDAESWGNEGSNFFVDIVGGGTFVESADLAAKEITNDGTTGKVYMKKEGVFKTYTLKFKDLTSSSKFRFYAPLNKRAFLDEINVSILPIETIETNEVGVASYVTKNALDFSGVEGLTAYVATAATNSTVTLAKVTEVPANTAIVVKGDADTSYAVPGTVTGKATAPAANLLKPGLWGVTDDDNIYALNSNGCFQKVAGGVEVPTGKAFIDLGTKAAKSVLTLNFGDATAINAIQTVNTANANAYNIAGQRVNGDAKGIVIVNGRKFINK